MVDKLAVLTTYTREFVRKANRLLNDASGFYEPDTEESHVWANLCAVVEHAEDTLIDIDTEITAAIRSRVRGGNSCHTSREE